MTTRKFRKVIWKHYHEHKRDLSWRRTRDPYKILVSEVMLQQTQVPRVLPKYRAFVKRFPTVQALAGAKLADVLREWQGLGYNRRAVALKRCAEIVAWDMNGRFPRDHGALLSLPAIGPVTAGDLMVFAWDIPVPVIETNIRSVFIHFFFKDKENIRDREIAPLVERTLDRENPREWYYALFDYGVYLKKAGNPGRRSAHHVRQSPFEGSHRQKRARVLRIILKKPATEAVLRKALAYEAKVLAKILDDLRKEGFIRKTKSGRYAAA